MNKQDAVKTQDRKGIIIMALLHQGWIGKRESQGQANKFSASSNQHSQYLFSICLEEKLCRDWAGSPAPTPAAALSLSPTSPNDSALALTSPVPPSYTETLWFRRTPSSERSLMNNCCSLSALWESHLCAQRFMEAFLPPLTPTPGLCLVNTLFSNSLSDQ